MSIFFQGFFWNTIDEYVFGGVKSANNVSSHVEDRAISSWSLDHGITFLDMPLPHSNSLSFRRQYWLFSFSNRHGLSWSGGVILKINVSLVEDILLFLTELLQFTDAVHSYLRILF